MGRLIQSGSAELYEVINHDKNTSRMVMLQSNVFEDLVRNAKMNASLKWSTEEDMSWYAEPFQLFCFVLIRVQILIL